MNIYTYGMLKYNNETFQRESALLDNDYKPTKYALLEKKVINAGARNGCEYINRIIYSDNLEELTEKLKNYISWYNYPIGFYKDIQGNIIELA